MGTPNFVGVFGKAPDATAATRAQDCVDMLRALQPKVEDAERVSRSGKPGSRMTGS